MQTSCLDSDRATVPHPIEAPGPNACRHVSCLSSVQEMPEVLESVVAAMVQLDYPRKSIFGTRLVLEEAICNAIKHGHQHDPRKVVEVRSWIRADRVLVEVEDDGPGFDPSKIPDATAPESLDRPCGRGLRHKKYHGQCR